MFRTRHRKVVCSICANIAHAAYCCTQKALRRECLLYSVRCTLRFYPLLALTSSVLPALPQRKPPNENQKAPQWRYLDVRCVAPYGFIRCLACRRSLLLRKSLLDGDCASNRMKTKRHRNGGALMFGALHLTILSVACAYFVSASCTATAHATDAPTMGLLPMPMSPIISTCAGTEEEPANCASECILPMVSVMP